VGRMNYRTRMLLLVFMDCCFVGTSVLSSYWISIVKEPWPEAVAFMVISMVCLSVSFLYFKLYNRVWRYASIGEFLSIIRATIIGSVVAYASASVLVGHLIPLYIATRTLETLLLTMALSRFAWRIFRDTYLKKNDNRRKTLVIGAGDCGSLIVREMRSNPSSTQFPIAFIDDNVNKHRMQIQGVPVAGGRESIPEVVESQNIDDIIIAMPSVSKNEIAEIIEICKLTNAKIKMIPSIHEIMEGKITLQTIRNVQVEDLLGRDPIKVDLAGIAGYLQGKVVMVTGAGGSIGSELCRQIAFFKPSKLLLLGHGENSIYLVESELQRLRLDFDIEPIIADVQDRKRMEEVFKQYRPQVVFHAAAHKHVPLMEKNPSEAIKNNVFGTKNVAECADLFGAERFVLISTDKAVNPTSIMGATKRIAEMIIQCMNVHSKTKFAAVRFGNVLGSRGSVIPRFKEQIARGGPVTVTHPDMIRYFMTIPEAVQLVIQAGAYAGGGEVFILDMGKPVKISTLAEDLIRFSGFEPGVDIRIEYTGIRPGEKLFEELLTDEEGLTSTMHNRIFIGKPTDISRSEMDFELKRLEQVLNEDQKVIRELIKLIVPSFQNVS